MTQGHTRKEVFVMVKDLLETLVHRPWFSVIVFRETMMISNWPMPPIGKELAAIWRV
jgi:hypothetical protein